MNEPNRRTIVTQLGRRANRVKTEQNWAAEQEQKKEELPEGHGRIVRDEQAPTVVSVKPPASHVDDAGKDVVPYKQINQPTVGQAQHGAAQTLDVPTPPAHQVGAAPVPQGAQVPGGHGDPRLSAYSEPRPVSYRIGASTTSPSGAQAVDPMQGMQSMAQQGSQQGGVHRVGGQAVQPSQGVSSMPATVVAVPGDVSPTQAAQFVAQQNMGQPPPQNQFQGGAPPQGVSVGPGAVQHGQPQPGQPQPGQPVPGQPIPTGTEVLQESAHATITLADDETMRRELEAAGLTDRMRTRKTTIERRVPDEQLAGSAVLDVTVILTSFLRSTSMLAKQVHALQTGTRRPANIGVLVVGGGEHDGGAIEGLLQNTYNLPISPWERFTVAMRVPTKYVCVLDDDCIPGEGWLEACVAAMENGLNAVIAAAGWRFGPDGTPSAYRGPTRHQSGSIIAEDFGEVGHLAAVVDAGALGWFFKTEWMPSVAQISPVGDAPYGWQIHASAALQLEEGVPTVVLPYTDPPTWGATQPAMEDGLRENLGMVELRRQVFDVYRDNDWKLVFEVDQKAIEVPLAPPPSADGETKPQLPPGAYWSPKLKRYVHREDDAWSVEHYELLTGEAWEETGVKEARRPGEAPDPKPERQVTETPQPDTSGDALDTEAAPAKKDAPGTLGRALPGAASVLAEPEPEPGPVPVVAALEPETLALEAGEHKWCACGESKTGALCDDSCDNRPFEPVIFELRKKSPKVVLCQCKGTKRPPYCDGTHAKVAAAQAKAEGGPDGQGSPE